MKSCVADAGLRARAGEGGLRAGTGLRAGEGTEGSEQELVWGRGRGPSDHGAPG